MKRIEIKKKGDRTVTIETKWLRIDEAAAYLGVNRSTFDLLRRRIPNGKVSSDVVVYDCLVLDRFANNELPEEVYEPETVGGGMQKRQRGPSRFGSQEGLTDPNSGKVYKSGMGKNKGAAALR